MALTIIPSIDLRNGQVVRLKQGDYAQQINYSVSPIDTAAAFAAAGATWMHIVDLDGAKEGMPVQTDLIRSIISFTRLNVEVGGGIRSTAHIQTLLDCGAARVVVGTKAIEDWAWFKDLVHQKAYHHKIILAVDAKEGLIATKGWTQTSARKAADVAKEISDWPVGAILYTDVAKDGMMTGPNLLHTKLLGESGKVPVIASGGVGNLSHIIALKALPIWGAIVGRSLYEGTLNLKDAIAETKK